MQPVKCLCGSAKCSGYMGGKQGDKLESDPNKDIIKEAEARLAASLCTRKAGVVCATLQILLTT